MPFFHIGEAGDKHRLIPVASAPARAPSNLPGKAPRGASPRGRGLHLVMSASDTLVHIPRNAWKPSRFTAMESLPAEIGEQICPLLCLHCQNPESLPDAGSADVRFDKASLARLARTSKRMHGLVQPFVYHFYATGDLPWRIATGVSRDSKTYPSDDDKSTVVQRPDLAADVKASSWSSRRTSGAALPTSSQPRSQ